MFELFFSSYELDIIFLLPSGGVHKILNFQKKIEEAEKKHHCVMLKMQNFLILPFQQSRRTRDQDTETVQWVSITMYVTSTYQW
jgi:hypothetical protein